MMTPADLARLLSELRVAGTDHSAVEAKRAETDLPGTTWETLSAFANTDGGTILLGVDEAGGAFDVIGVEDPARISRELQSTCSELEPPLRPLISVVEYDGRTVIAAELAPVSRSARPCHRRGAAFTRVGDADQTLTQPEIDETLANRSGYDHSRRPAAEHARLDADIARAFCERVRSRFDGSPADDDALLRRWGALDDADHPTVAGALALGQEPAGVIAAARIAYRRWPTAGDPPGTRHAGTHFEGRVGELLDRVLVRLLDDLGPIQVEQEGHVVDAADVPPLALREMISNALLHRSLTDVQESASIAVEVSDEAVVITSPGGLHVGADTSTLGLDSISGVRNLTLVRICEQLQTPGGARIIENHASGIAKADDACRALGTMPALFIDLPARFQVVLFRGALSTDAAAELLNQHGVPTSPENVRLVAVAQRLSEAKDQTPISGLERIAFDARLAARALASTTVEDASARLLELEHAGVLDRQHTRHGTSWSVRVAAPGAGEEVEEASPAPARPRRRRRDQPDRVIDVLRAISQSEEGALLSSEIGREMGLSSPTSVGRWIGRAGDAGLVEPTNESLFASNRRYRLTRSGEARLARDQQD